MSSDDTAHIAGRKYPKAEHESLKQLDLAKYGEMYLTAKHSLTYTHGVMDGAMHDAFHT